MFAQGVHRKKVKYPNGGEKVVETVKKLKSRDGTKPGNKGEFRCLISE